MLVMHNSNTGLTSWDREPVFLPTAPVELDFGQGVQYWASHFPRNRKSSEWSNRNDSGTGMLGKEKI